MSIPPLKSEDRPVVKVGGPNVTIYSPKARSQRQPKTQATGQDQRPGLPLLVFFTAGALLLLISGFLFLHNANGNDGNTAKPPVHAVRFPGMEPFPSAKGTPFADTYAGTGKVDAAGSSGNATTPGTSAPATGVTDQLAKLYTEGKLFNIASYPIIRNLVAEQFAKKYEQDIRAGYGANYDKMNQWFASTPEKMDLRGEFYTALIPGKDSISGACKIFSELVEKNPDAFPEYGQLAIAIAVTWDNNNRRFYTKQSDQYMHYKHHQERTGAVLATEKKMGAMENFAFYQGRDKRNFGGRVACLPWEFLVYVVNNDTPESERDWAGKTYYARMVKGLFKNKKGIGEVYEEVPYDNGMLAAHDRGGAENTSARLRGSQYTLPNIKERGGVCAMQADFAARVAKSLAAPAFYVGGQGRAGGLHAWVMWVEVKSFSPTKVVASLKSHGRYFGDFYYVGKTCNPQTDEMTTDRELQLLLHTTAQSPQRARMVSLIMEQYPSLSQKLNLTMEQKSNFLGQLIELSPTSPAIWEEIARMSRDGEITPDQTKKMSMMIDSFFRVMANFPDFTNKLFKDMMTYETKFERRRARYDALLKIYYNPRVPPDQRRPDLACEKLLEFADEMIEAEEYSAICKAMANTIMMLPEEGRYVPKLLDKLEFIVDNHTKKTDVILGFYQQFLPKVPKARGSRVSSYCVETYKRAIAYFQKCGAMQQAAFWQNELGKLTGGR